MRPKGIISVLVSCIVVFIRAEALAVQSVNLAWDASPDPNVQGYVVYYGPASRHYTNAVFVGNATTATIPNLAEGATCYFATTAYDRTGLESEFSNEVSYSVPSVLASTTATAALRTKGAGTISPDYSTRPLTIGKSYTITAIPGAGQVFAGWRGTTNSPVARLTFAMSRGLALEANFVPNPFGPMAGSYNGLFYEDDTVRHGSAGIFSVSVTARGTCSGRLQFGGQRYSFSSRLDLDGRVSTVIPRGSSNALTLQLRFGTGGEADQAFGHVSDGIWTTALQGDRAVFNAYTNPAPFAGSYNLILPGQGGDPTQPAGDGFGSLRVTTAGRVSFSGMLADNSRFSQSVAISKHGHWPLYAPLYAGKGSVLSWLTFTNRTKDDLNGWLSWIKPADVTAVLYPGGFTNLLNAVGSAYVAPAGSTNPVVSFTNACVRFCGGELAADFTNTVTFGLMNKVVNLSSNKFSMTFARATGKFSGRVQDPQNGLSRVFKGALLQKANAGYGYLLATNQSSRVVIVP